MAARGVKIADLPNFGPASVAMLESAGIKTLRQLQGLGSVPAYAKVKRLNKLASLNLLWAIEGALSGRPWQDVAKLDRERLLNELIRLAPECISARRRAKNNVITRRAGS